MCSGFLLLFFPAVFECDGTVENRSFGGRVIVGCEVADALELEFASALVVLCDIRLDFNAFNDFERFGVEHLAEIAFGLGCGILNAEQTVVDTRRGIDGCRCRHPVECALDLARAAGQTAACVGVVGAVYLLDVALGVLLDTGALDDVRALEGYLSVGCETEEFLGGILHEVVTLDIDFA